VEEEGENYKIVGHRSVRKVLIKKYAGSFSTYKKKRHFKEEVGRSSEKRARTGLAIKQRVKLGGPTLASH